LHDARQLFPHPQAPNAPQFPQAFGADDAKIALAPQARGLEARVRLGRAALGVCTGGYGARLDIERAAEREEGLRLLYVGATRARDHLVVSLHHKETATRSHAYRVVNDAGDLSMGGPTPAGLGARPAPLQATRPVPERTEWNDERSRRFAEATRTSAVAATALSGDADHEPAETPAWKRGRAGTAIGRAVHSVLQSVDLATGVDLEALTRAQAAAEGVADRVGEVIRAARAALESNAVRGAVASGRFWREVYVGAEIEGTTLEGFVDLLVERDGDLVVVDYKTDRVQGDPDALVARYRLQGAAYAAALEEVLGRPVTECTFVFVGDGHAVERSVDDLPGAVAEVRQRLSLL